MTEKEARELAAGAWRADATKGKAVDPELCEEFARILRREVGRAKKELRTKKPYWLPE